MIPVCLCGFQYQSVRGYGGSLQAEHKPQTRLWVWAAETAEPAVDDHWPGFREEQGQGLKRTSAQWKKSNKVILHV